ncbi:alpha-amylase family glycosyl hydrolase [Nitrospira sp. Ecomares 2.1]
MTTPISPSLYQINTRVWLTELSQPLGRRATLDDLPDAELDRLAKMGFDWIWFLSVWRTGPAGQQVSRSHHEWRREFEETLPDLHEKDIAGSGFAITGYTVHPDLGGDAPLARLRERLRKRGLKLMLDFVPNHTGLDHPWVETHPEYSIAGSELDLARAPKGNHRTNPFIDSTSACSRCSSNRRFVKVTGPCSKAYPRGRVTEHRIVSWSMPGKAQERSGCWSW